MGLGFPPQGSRAVYESAVQPGSDVKSPLCNESPVRYIVSADYEVSS